MNVPSYPGAAEQICKLKPGSFSCGNDAWFHKAQSFTLQLLIFLCLWQSRAEPWNWWRSYFNNFLQNCRVNEENPLSVTSVLLPICVLVLKSSIQHCLKTNPFPFHWGKRLMSVTHDCGYLSSCWKKLVLNRVFFIIAELLSDHLPLYCFLPQPLWKQTSCPRHRNPQSAAASVEPLEFCQQPLEVVPDVIAFSVLPWKYPVETKDNFSFGGQHFLCSQGCTVGDVRHEVPQRNHD